MKTLTSLDNRLLASLPPADSARLRPFLQDHDMRSGESLHEPRKPVSWVHFPMTGVASVVTRMSDGACIEAATVGNEGMVGLPVFLDTGSASVEAFVQIPGKGLRMRADAYRREMSREGALAHLAEAYTRIFIMLIAQSAACNRVHSSKQRCARWLLMSHDRVTSDTFHLTQEFLAEMLGVRRATVTEAAGPLKKAGIIEYQRGWITIVDRTRLERASCECYATIRREFDALSRKKPG